MRDHKLVQRAENKKVPESRRMGDTSNRRRQGRERDDETKVTGRTRERGK